MGWYDKIFSGVTEDPIFVKQVDLLEGFVNGLYGLNDQFRELLCFHPIVDLCAKSLLEVGGVLPTDILFDWLNVANDIDLDSPDYVGANDGYLCSKNINLMTGRSQLYEMLRTSLRMWCQLGLI